MPSELCPIVLRKLRERLVSILGDDAVYVNESDGSIMVYSAMSGLPMGSILKASCYGSLDAPLITVDLPCLFHVFDSLGPGKLREFLEKFLYIIPARIVEPATTDNGMPRLLINPPKDMVAGRSPDKIAESMEALFALAAAIVEWISEAYQALREGRPIPELELPGES